MGKAKAGLVALNLAVLGALAGVVVSRGQSTPSRLASSTLATTPTPSSTVTVDTTAAPTSTTTTAQAPTTITVPPTHLLTVDYYLQDRGDPAGYSCSGSDPPSVGVIGGDGTIVGNVAMNGFGTTVATPPDIPGYAPVSCLYQGTVQVPEASTYTLTQFDQSYLDPPDRTTFGELTAVGWVWVLTRQHYFVG